jgi:hypothetical protein
MANLRELFIPLTSVDSQICTSFRGSMGNGAFGIVFLLRPMINFILLRDRGKGLLLSSAPLKKEG